MEGVTMGRCRPAVCRNRFLRATGRLVAVCACAAFTAAAHAYDDPESAHAAGLSAQRPLRIAVVEAETPVIGGPTGERAAADSSGGAIWPADSSATRSEGDGPAAAERSEGSSARSPLEQRPLGTPVGAIAPIPDDAPRGWMPAVSPSVAELIRIGGGLGAVLLLVFVLRLWLRAHGMGAVAAGRPSGVLEILARYPVSRGQTLLVLRFGRRIVLAHQAGGTMQTLSELSDPNEVAQMLGRLEAGASGRDAERFRSVLERFEREHDRTEAAPAARASVARTAPPAEGHLVEVVDLTRGGRRRMAAGAGRTGP